MICHKNYIICKTDRSISGSEKSPDIKAQENNAVHKTDTLNYNWDRFSLSVGGFMSGLSSDIILGSQQVGLGLSINPEDALGLHSS